MAAKGMQFPWRSDSGTFSTKSDVIWGMSVKFISKNFDVLQINMYGNKEVTDMDGSVIDERKYAERALIQFTPTTLFYGENGKEIFRIPGYLSPKFYRRAFAYVLDRGPQRKILLPRWSRDKLRAERAKGGS